jgi:hypothetical protein
MSASGPTVPTNGDQLAPVLAGVSAVLRAGLPIRPSTAPEALLRLDGVTARSVNPDDRLARVDALDRLIRAELKRFGLVDLRKAAALLFGATKVGGTLTERRRHGAASAQYEFDHFRKRIEPRIAEQLAWQLYQDGLQYIRRAGDGDPIAGSGQTPIISADHIEHPDVAEREILLSLLWSDVYGLRAELIRREAAAGDPERISVFQEGDDAALWYLARLLTRIDAYLGRYGQEILHGAASFNAESLIRLAGWTGEVTVERARELRFAMARAGEWDRVGFLHRISR